MQTNKFHSKKNIRRNLTQINTATTQKRYQIPSNSETSRPDSLGLVQSSLHGARNSGRGQNIQPPLFPPHAAVASHQPSHTFDYERQVVSHVVIPEQVPIGTKTAPHITGTPINQDQGRSQDLSRAEILKRGENELSYYMSKDHKSVTNKNKQSRNYRNRRSSSSDSESSRSERRVEQSRRYSRDDSSSRSHDYSSGDNRYRDDRGSHGSYRGNRENLDSHRNDRNNMYGGHRPRSPRFEMDNREQSRYERDYDWHYEGSYGDSQDYRVRNRGRDSFSEEYVRQVYEQDYHARDDRSQSSRNQGHKESFRDELEDRRNVRCRDTSYSSSSDRYEHSDRHSEHYDKRQHGDVRVRTDYSGNRGFSEKRSLSPISQEGHTSRRIKYRRDWSPVSDGRSMGELKIHVSNHGRWIETDRETRDLSPVSAGEYKSRDTHRESYETRMISDSVTVESADEEGAYLSDAEMVSDEESFSEKYFDNLRNWDQNEFFDKGHRSHLHESREDHSRRDEFDRHGRKYVHDGQSRKSDHDEFSREGHNDDARRPSDSDRHSQLSDHHQTEQAIGKLSIKLPNLCRYYNSNRGPGCKKRKCLALHVCKAYVLENCSYGEKCIRSHNFFTGQAGQVLKTLNPHIQNTAGMHQKIIIMLQRRILIAVGRSELLYVIDEKEKELDKRLAGERYRETDVSVRSGPSSKALSQSRESRAGSKHSETKIINTERDRERNSREKQSDSCENELEREDNKVERPSETINEKKPESRELSPVSGDEGNWDDYEKYEKISDDGLGDKTESADKNINTEEIKADINTNKTELDAVSPVRSDDGLNKPLEFPLPTPENIAVPIGQNDPLVFNRPLGNNPEKYIGPLNRPPPSVPLIPGAVTRPLFPVQSHVPVAGDRLPRFNPQVPPPMSHPGVGPATMPVQGLPQPFIPPPGALSVPPPGLMPGPVPGPNHLPSVQFMKHVIQSLPAAQNTFKNDNTPAVIEAASDNTKKSQTKVEKDPELKEPIKTLWKFPHKSLVNMSVIEFVTETEAYKEEFIAEIVRLLVSLQLPYVTLKKLISVIKEKILINVSSVTDMRKILDMYAAHFKIIETVDSDDEDDEESRKRVQIKANITLGFCEKHGFLPFAMGKCDCNSLHMCKFYVFSNCPNKLCKFGHSLKTEHNMSVLKNHKLHRLTGEELIDFMSDIDNRNKWTIPNLCKYYTREKGCYKGNSTDHQSICHSLHICYYELKGKCANKDCDKTHSILAKQPHSLLQKYGLDPEVYGVQKILEMVSKNMWEAEKDRLIKNIIARPSAQKAESTSVSSENSESETGKAQGKRSGQVKATQHVKVPSICKFYQNEMGCRKKDWGPSGKCLFLHVCQYFVSGECKFGDKCKRSHDLYKGQVAELLKEYNIHTECLTVNEILGLLNKTGTVVELPIYDEPEVKRIDEKVPELPERELIKETVEEVAGKPVEPESTKHSRDGDNSHAKKSMAFYDSQNIEDVIKQIMEERRVDKDGK